MGSIGGDYDKTKLMEGTSAVDCTDDDTQPFDSQFSPVSSSGTVPFDDAVPLEDTFETQMANLDGETQVVDLGDETQVVDIGAQNQVVNLCADIKVGNLDAQTQVVNLCAETQVTNLGGETQVVNFGGETQALDFDCVENVGIQSFGELDIEVAVSCSSEGTDRTEVLGDTEELSDDDSEKNIGSRGRDWENLQSATFCRQVDSGFEAELDPLINGKCNSELHLSTTASPGKRSPEPKPESVKGGFTSIRVASLRASGLAARNAVHKKTNSGSSSALSESQSVMQLASECNGIPYNIRNESKFWEEDQQHAQGYSVVMNELRKVDDPRVCSSTVRKLFEEDAPAQARRPDDDNNYSDGGDLPHLFASENELAGLSYINSQEPGESSQASALDFVDRFIEISVKEFDQKVECGKSTGGTSKAIPSAKGTQNLIKRAYLRDAVRERGFFDWDENLEDEGGGEFFIRKKESLFDVGGQSPRCFTQPRKPSCIDFKARGAAKCKHKDNQADIHEEMTDLAYSDSRVMLHNLKGIDESTEVTKVNCKKKLVKEFDEQLKTAFKDGNVAIGTKKDMVDMLDVGVDTQMAAEAMEALCFGMAMDDHDFSEANQTANNILKGSPREARNTVHSKQHFLQEKICSSDSKVIVRKSKRINGSSAKLSMEPSVSSLNRYDNMEKQWDSEIKRAKSERGKLEAKGHFASMESENIWKSHSKGTERRKDRRTLKRSHIDEVDGCHVPESSSCQTLVKKRHLQDECCTFTPVACRTRQRLEVNELKMVDTLMNEAREETNDPRDMGAPKGQGKRSIPHVDACKLLNAKDKFSKLGSVEPKSTGVTTAVKLDAMSYPKAKRTRPKMSSMGQETVGQSIAGLNRSKADATCTHMNLGLKTKTRSSARACPAFPCLDKESQECILQQVAVDGGSSCRTLRSNSDASSVNPILKDVIEAHALKHSDGKGNGVSMSPVENAEANASLEASPINRCKPSASKCTTPVNSTTLISSVSPICMGDEYLKQSCRKNLSLTREINNLIAAAGPETTSPSKVLRKRREMSDVRVLFSHHLDDDIIKQQKKILARLGASVASSVSDATHFITDTFVRTRNMLEAIAFGKPVVTHLWLEICGQASCLIDERNYILRDAKKEKEFGFSLPASLARACQHPLLQGQRVLITPNTKPSKEILMSLVKAVHGMAVERVGRSTLKNDKILDELLVLSCEEDYAICVPFLEKGVAIYSSELLLNGIVIQKLEYQRHRLFVDSVKRTRSTMWLKRESNQYFPVTKCK